MYLASGYDQLSFYFINLYLFVHKTLNYVPGRNRKQIPRRPQGKNLIDEVLKSGDQQFIYTSVDRHGAKSLDNPTSIPHFIQKHRIEQHLIERTKDDQMDWAILCPTAFYDNLTPGFMGKVFATCFRSPSCVSV